MFYFVVRVCMCLYVRMYVDIPVQSPVKKAADVVAAMEPEYPALQRQPAGTFTPLLKAGQLTPGVLISTGNFNSMAHNMKKRWRTLYNLSKYTKKK